MTRKPLFKCIDHVEFVVQNVNDFVDFFKMFGYEIVRETEHHEESIELKLPGEDQTILEIHKLLGGENPEINHIAFESEDIYSVSKLLEEKGIEHRGPFFFEPTGRLLLNFRNPDGLRLQVTSKEKLKD